MSLEVAQHIVHTTPILSGVGRVEFLDEGYSTDEKYVLYEGDAPKYLLRLGEGEHSERRKRDFDIMEQQYSRGVRCSKPYLFGMVEGENLCYTILSYIPGQNAEKALPPMSEQQQFDVGITFGEELLKIHELPCPDEAFDWATYRRDKYHRRVQELEAMGRRFVRQNDVEAYVEANLWLLDEAPVHFQHDDFHPGNLIIHEGEMAGVIDFNRSEWGDPIEDFYKVPWFTVDTSIPFARGQFEGYFSKGEPENFWKRYNLYVAMNLHGSLVWVENYYPEQVDEWQDKIRNIVGTHDFENSGPPFWYAE